MYPAIVLGPNSDSKLIRISFFLKYKFLREVHQPSLPQVKVIDNAGQSSVTFKSISSRPSSSHGQHNRTHLGGGAVVPAPKLLALRIASI